MTDYATLQTQLDHFEYNQLREQTPDAKALGRLLWQGIESNQLNLGNHTELWPELVAAHESASGKALFHLIQSTTTQHTYTRNGYFYGYNEWMDDIFAAKKEDPQAAAYLQEHWCTLPKPHQPNVAYQLVRFAMMPLEQAPKNLLAQLIPNHLQGGCSKEETQRRREIWSPAVWERALIDGVDDALNQAEFALNTTTIANEILPLLETAQKIRLFTKIPFVSDCVPLLQLFNLFKQDEMHLLEQVLQEHASQPTPRDDGWGTPTFWPLFMALFVYLQNATQHHIEIPPTIDDFVEIILTHYKPPGYDTCPLLHEYIRQQLQKIPSARLDLILQSLPTTPWYFLTTSGTKTMYAFAIEQIAALHSPKVQERDSLSTIFFGGWDAADLGVFGNEIDKFIPYLADAIAQNQGSQQLLLLEFLRRAPGEKSIPALCAALQAKSKVVRETAIDLLRRYSTDTLLPSITPILSAKTKGVRLSAAQLLATLPGTEASLATAQKRLHQEKNTDVKRVLETVALSTTPQISHALSPEAELLLTAIDETNGNDWEELVVEGPALVEAYWAYLCRQQTSGSIEVDEGPGLAWSQLVTQFPDDPRVLQRALYALPALDWNGKNYLDELNQVYTDFPQKFALWFANGSYQVPGEWSIESYELFSEDRCLDWLQEHNPPNLSLVFFKELQHKQKRHRDRALQYFLEHPQFHALEEQLLQLLQHGDDKVRLSILELVQYHLIEAAMPILKELLKGKPRKKLKEVLQQTLGLLRSHTQGIENYPETTEGHAKLDAFLAELPLLPLPKQVFIDDFETFHWSTGEELSHESQNWFLSQLFQEGRKTHNPFLSQVAQRLTPNDRYQLKNKLQRMELFDEFMLPALGGIDDIAQFGKQLNTYAKQQKKRWGADGVDVLIRIGQGSAVRWLDHWRRKTTREGLRKHINKGLQTLAKKQSCNLEELVDRHIDTFGFHAQGIQSLTYGERTLQLEFRSNNELTITDEKGALLPTPPNAQKNENPREIERLRNWILAVKQEAIHIHNTQTERLQAAMVSGRTWNLVTFQKELVHHPLQYHLTRSLTFFAQHPTQGIQPFRLTDKGEYLDQHTEEIDLNHATQIGIVHPIQLQSQHRQQWMAMWQDLGRQAPFPQLERPCFVASTLPNDSKKALATLSKAPPDHFLRTLEALGYTLGSHQDDAMVFDSFREIGNFEFQIHHTPLDTFDYGREEDVIIDGVEIRRIDPSQPRWEYEQISWHELPPVVFSEFWYELQQLTATPQNSSVISPHKHPPSP